MMLDVALRSVKSAVAKKSGEHGFRSFCKAASWRIVGTCDTFIIAFVITGKLGMSLSISGIEVGTKVFLFWLHERAWLRIPWGMGK